MTRLDKKIGFIGGGNMGEAMINGLIKSGLSEPGAIWVSDVRKARLGFLNERYGIHTTLENEVVFENVDILILAVKPQHMGEVLKGLASGFPQTIKGVKLVISIAAGIPIKKIEQHLYEPLDVNSKGLLPIVRVMPNTPALVLAGMAAMAGNEFAGKADMADAGLILEAVGQVIELQEEDLDAVTAVSGSGPAYIFYVIESMVEAASELGLRPSHALQLTLETTKGAVRLLEETGEAPASLRKKVTSKGGTTEAALNVLTRHQVKEHFVEAIRAAAKRSRELADELG